MHLAWTTACFFFRSGYDMDVGTSARQKFYVEIIKPSHYDDDGYVIQWWRAFIPSNSLGLLVGACRRRSAAANYSARTSNSSLTATTRRIPSSLRSRSSAASQNNGGRGIVLIGRRSIESVPPRGRHGEGVPPGGNSGRHRRFSRQRLPLDAPGAAAGYQGSPSSWASRIFAGEAEETLDGLLLDAYRGELKPVYNYLLELPDLGGQVTPFLPPEVARRSFNLVAFDVGRGCPFRCSFCTIINVQGRKSRYREPDDVEQMMRAYVKKGVKRFFITDDNMARNKNWEPIFDRLIQLREQEGLPLKFLLQVDTMCHKIPGFIEKAARAGCHGVFIGMESVNPENLVAAKKFQNNIVEYRRMLQAWRAHGVITYAGYILGFPADTPESIERDIRVIQEELPIDILEFFILTPLPGSADHREMYQRGEWMNPDMNLYDVEHVTTHHPRMTDDEWRRHLRTGLALVLQPRAHRNPHAPGRGDGGGGHPTVVGDHEFLWQLPL